MKVSQVIEGLSILQKYNEIDGHNVACSNDILVVFTTDAPLTINDIYRMIQLGWSQDSVSRRTFEVSDYRREESWHCYP